MTAPGKPYVPRPCRSRGIYETATGAPNNLDSRGFDHVRGLDQYPYQEDRAAVCRYRTPAGRIRIDELLAGPAANPARERTGMDTKGGGLRYNSSPPSAEWKSNP